MTRLTRLTLALAALMRVGGCSHSTGPAVTPEGLTAVRRVEVAPPADAGKWTLHWYNRVAEFRAQNASLPAGRRHLVLVGDSLTEAFPADLLPGHPVLNRGIIADGVRPMPGPDAEPWRGVTNRLAESIIDTQPDHLVLLIGTNDMSQFGSDMEYWLDGIRTVIRTARAHHPGLPITLTTLPPAGRKYSAHAKFNPRVVEYNPMIKALAAEEKCSLVDLYAMVVDDEGMLADEYTGDGLHLTRAVYEKWAAELQKILTD